MVAKPFCIASSESDDVVLTRINQRQLSCRRLSTRKKAFRHKKPGLRLMNGWLCILMLEMGCTLPPIEKATKAPQSGVTRRVQRVLR